MFSINQKLSNILSFLLVATPLWLKLHEFMSQTTPLLRRLKCYLGPHNHRAVHMTYSLLTGSPQQKHAICLKTALDVKIFPSHKILDDILGNPLSQVYICHDSGLTRWSLLCPAARSPILLIAQCTMHIGKSAQCTMYNAQCTTSNLAQCTFWEQ